MLKASQVRTKRAAFSDAVMSRQPHELHRLVGHDADRVALDTAVAGEDVRRVQRLRLEELGVVQDVFDHRVHVVRLVRAVRDERVQLAVLVGGREVRLLRVDRRLGEVVGRQVRQQLLDVLDGVLLVASTMWWATPDTALWVRAPPSSSKPTSSPVTVLMTSGPVMNMCEVWSTMTVKSVIAGEYTAPAGAGTDDQADLRDDTARMGVAAEDLAVGAEEATPSWIRAPPESLMPMTGQPVFSAKSITLTIFWP